MTADCEIVRRKIIVPIPPRWKRYVLRHGIDLEDMIATMVCDSRELGWVGRYVPGYDFPIIWQLLLEFPMHPVGRMEMGRLIITIREDLAECLHLACSSVGASANELILRTLNRNLPLVTGGIPLPSPRMKPSLPCNVLEFIPSPK